VDGACFTNGRCDAVNAYAILIWKPERKNHLEDLDIVGRIILKYIFQT
jgi:hypothetical protein